LTAGARAQFAGDYCTIGTVDIENSVVSSGVHTKMSYEFTCSDASANSGQITKMLIKVPFTGIQNLEASDSYGTLDVLEGPEYVGKTESETDSTIGVIFRKGLLIENETNSYKLALEYDTASLVSTSESGLFTLKPEGLGSTPKITIISKGVTETTISIENIDYKLILPEGSSIQKTTKGCNIDGGTIVCTGLTPEKLNSVEVQWEGSSEEMDIPFEEIIGKLLNTGKESAPSIINLVKNIVEKGMNQISD
ncbi:MAG: hypothetical protein R6U26_01520, partial [Candidatus Undinarchaeales archaeon]